MKKLLIFCMAAIIGLTFIKSALAEKNPGSEYTVGIGDVLEINILQPEKVTNTVIVSPDGSITFPYVGLVYVKGLTLLKIQKEIADKLMDGYMKYPVVTVFLKESNSRRFFVYGEVIRPGVYSLQENTTILKAIAIAGGFTKQNQNTIVKIIRLKGDGKTYETINVNIAEIINGAIGKDILIKPEDTITISIPILKEAPTIKFFVYGEVNRPGVYPLEENTTVLKAIAIAGGFTKYGSASRVKVLRPKENQPGYETIPIYVNEIMSGSSKADILLEAGDTVVVSEGVF